MLKIVESGIRKRARMLPERSATEITMRVRLPSGRRVAARGALAGASARRAIPSPPPGARGPDGAAVRYAGAAAPPRAQDEAADDPAGPAPRRPRLLHDEGEAHAL